MRRRRFIWKPGDLKEAVVRRCQHCGQAAHPRCACGPSRDDPPARPDRKIVLTFEDWACPGVDDLAARYGVAVRDGALGYLVGHLLGGFPAPRRS
jgi:hypothetical protein